MTANSALFSRTEKDSEGHWLSVSDLMAGLMMIFLFIAILYMREVQKVIVIADETHSRIYIALQEEFKNDLAAWNAEIVRETMTVRFKEPDVLFDRGGAKLKPVFEQILSDFFPRYVRVLEQFSQDIDEIRIEGHTSSEWQGVADREAAYFQNMELSQNRTRNVLEYCLSSSLVNNAAWVRAKIAAVGLSSTKAIIENGAENEQKSRRVEFRVKTNFEQQIIRKTLKEREAS